MDQSRMETLEILRIIRLKTGEVPNIRYDEKERRFVIEIAKRTGPHHN